MNNRDKQLRAFRRKKSDENWTAYKALRNRVNIEIRKSKSTFYKDLLNENANKPDKFWKTLKEIYPKQSTSNTSSFLIGDVLTTDKSNIANGFCEYFSCVASKLKEKAFVLRDVIWQRKVDRNPRLDTDTRFRFEPVTSAEVLGYVKQLKRKKATGIDNLPPGFLKDVAINICNPLTFVINLSLATGSIPSELKCGKVTPIYKSGQKSDFGNYRPITVLPAVSKVLEKCVRRQLVEYLESNNLLSDNQYGFRPNRSTESAATLLVDDIRKNIDDGLLTGAVFLDLSKAFDTLSHGILINKLERFGISGSDKQWFTDYLFGRMQTVQYNGAESETKPVFCGVPQGSVLGPILFTMYFNDVPTRNCKILMFADDTVIYAAEKSQQSVASKLSEDLQLLSPWLENHELVLNLKKGKTEVMLFGTPARLKNLDDLNIKINGVAVSNTRTYKYLGVNLDRSVTFCEHSTKTYKKATSRLRLLKRIRSNLTVAAARAIYNTMILPTFTYCSILTPHRTPTFNNQLDSLHRRANFIINRNERNTAAVKSIQSYLDSKVYFFVFRSLNNMLPSRLNNYFQLHSSNTRNNNNLIRLPRCRTETFRKSLRFFGGKLFNELPINIRRADNLRNFKQLLEELL